MRYRIGSAVAVVAVVLQLAVVSAHHGFGIVFDASSRSILTGTLTRVDWRNPHIALSLDAKTDRGQVEVWKIEGAAPAFFARNGISKTAFQEAIDQRVTVEVHRAKDGSLLGSLRKITFPNGTSVTSDPNY